MSLIDNFLGKQNLQGLTPAQQEEARSQGWNQLLMGSIFGGKGLASGYAAAQGVIPAMQAAEQQRRVNQAVENSMVNLGVKPGSQLAMLQSQMDETNPALALPDANRLTSSALQRNVQQKNAAPGIGGTGLTASQQMLQRFDPTVFSQNIAPLMARQDPKKALEVAQMGAPKTMESTGLQLDPFSQAIVGAIPTAKDNIQQSFNLTTGQFEATPVVGARSARAELTLPALAQGEEYLFDANRNPVGIRNATGAIQALTERQQATTAATVSQTPRVVKDSLGRDVVVFDTPPALGGKSAPQASPPTLPGGGQPQSAFDVILTKNFENVLANSQKQSDTARSRAGTLDQLQLAISNPAFTTGSFSEQKTGIMSALNWFGVTGDKAKSYLQSAQAARTGFADLANQSIQDLSGPMSDKDILFAKDRNAKVTDLKESIQFAIDVARAADARKIQKYEFLRANAGPDAEKMWSESPVGSQSLYEDPNLRKYLPKAVIDEGPDRGKTAYRLPNGKVMVYE